MFQGKSRITKKEKKRGEPERLINTTGKQKTYKARSPTKAKIHLQLARPGGSEKRDNPTETIGKGLAYDVDVNIEVRRAAKGKRLEGQGTQGSAGRSRR